MPSIPTEDRLIVALDVPTAEEARDIVARLGSAVHFYKIGLQLQYAVGGGMTLAKALLDQGKKVFLDSKLQDIDQTVVGAITNIARAGVSFLTIHGNEPTFRAAITGRGQSNLKILSVTVLTSLDADDMKDMGLDRPVEDLVLHRARKALEWGCDGIVASGLEARQIKAMAGDRLLIVTPGIRSSGVARDDQKRVTTPRDAILAGADHLVVGRQILRAANPGAEAERVFQEIDSALAEL